MCVCVRIGARDFGPNTNLSGRIRKINRQVCAWLGAPTWPPRGRYLHIIADTNRRVPDVNLERPAAVAAVLV